MGPVIVAALRTLFSRAAIEAAGKVAVSSVAPRAGARMMAARAAQAEAGTPALQKGMARFFRGSGEVSAANRWLTPNLSQAQAAATRTGSPLQYVDVPHGSPQLKGAAGQGWFSRAKYASFEASDDIAKGLKPYRAAEATPRQSIRDTLSGYAQQFASNVGQRAKASSIGQYYSAAMDVVRTRDPNNQEPARNRPNADPFGNFPNLSVDQLSALSGKSYAEFQSADKEAEQKLKSQESQEELERSTQKLNEAFKRMMSSLLLNPLKAAVSIGAAGAALNSVNERIIGSQIVKHAMYSTTFANIQAARSVQDIAINRRTAAETAGSAKFLNDAQMRGRDEWSKVNATFQNLTNYTMGIGQSLSNGVAQAANNLLEITKIRMLLEKRNGDAEGEDKHGLMSSAIKFAIQGQRTADDKKRNKPIKGI